MLIVRIEERAGRSPEEKSALVNTVCAGLKSALGVTDEKMQVRYMTYSEENFQLQVGASANFLQIEITVFEGKSLKAKQNLYQIIAADVARVRAVNLDDVLILLREEPRENWGMCGEWAANFSFPYTMLV